MKMILRWQRNLLVTACALAGLCGNVHPVDSFAADSRMIWQSRDQFVALERQDRGPDGPALPNDHPAELTPDRLTALLASIDLRSADNDKPVPLFTRAAVQVLAPHLRQGLRQAAPGEDVTFAVIGLHDALYGLAKSPKVTTGRVFYKGGRLNIIVGLAHQEVNDRDDRRLSPFTPGSRMKAPAGDWALMPHAGQDAFVQVRKDWAAFGDEWRASAVPVPVVEKKIAPVQVPQAQSTKRPDDTSRTVERLTILNELKEKGLITEEEYRAKRKEILKGL